MKKTILFCLLAAFVLTACEKQQGEKRATMPKEYTSAYQEIYGHCYDSVPYAVVALDLYSDGLSLNSKHRMEGTGYNLYLSDIFVPDSLLENGTYHSSDSIKPFTFLPGAEFEGTPVGIYLLYIEDGMLKDVQMLDSGTVVVSDAANHMRDLKFTLYYTSAYGEKAIYETHFQGKLQPYKK